MLPHAVANSAEFKLDSDSLGGVPAGPGQGTRSSRLLARDVALQVPDSLALVPAPPPKAAWHMLFAPREARAQHCSFNLAHDAQPVTRPQLEHPSPRCTPRCAPLATPILGNLPESLDSVALLRNMPESWPQLAPRVLRRFSRPCGLQPPAKLRDSLLSVPSDSAGSSRAECAQMVVALAGPNL